MPSQIQLFSCSSLSQKGLLSCVSLHAGSIRAICQEVQVIYIWSSQKCAGERIPPSDATPTTSDICGIDGECPSLLLWLPPQSMERNWHFQGAVHLIYLSMKWVMPYNWPQGQGNCLRQSYPLFRCPHLTRWIHPKDSFILSLIYKE